MTCTGTQYNTLSSLTSNAQEQLDDERTSERAVEDDIPETQSTISRAAVSFIRSEVSGRRPPANRVLRFSSASEQNFIATDSFQRASARTSSRPPVVAVAE